MPKSLEINDQLNVPAADLRYRFSRSSGPGGQHVNKVETRVELLFLVDQSVVLSDAQKSRLRKKVRGKIDAEGNVVLSAQAARSRKANLEDCEQQLRDLILSILEAPVERKASRATRSSKVARGKAKRRQSEKKGVRRRLDPRMDLESDLL